MDLTGASVNRQRRVSGRIHFFFFFFFFKSEEMESTHPLTPHTDTQTHRDTKTNQFWRRPCCPALYSTCSGGEWGGVGGHDTLYELKDDAICGEAVVGLHASIIFARWHRRYRSKHPSARGMTKMFALFASTSSRLSPSLCVSITPFRMTNQHQTCPLSLPLAAIWNIKFHTQNPSPTPFRAIYSCLVTKGILVWGD